MKKIITIICLSVIMCGCASSITQWKEVKFITPQGKVDQERIAAQNDCIKEVEKMVANDIMYVMGVGPYHMMRVKQYQGCMSEKGFTCEEDCANSYKDK